MHRPQTTSKDGCLQEGTLEAESNAGVCNVLRGEKKRLDGETSGMMRKLVSWENLGRAFKRVERNKGNAGVDGGTVQEMYGYFAQHHQTIVRSLQNGSYEPIRSNGSTSPKRMERNGSWAFPRYETG